MCIELWAKREYSRFRELGSCEWVHCGLVDVGVGLIDVLFGNFGLAGIQRDPGGFFVDLCV